MHLQAEIQVERKDSVHAALTAFGETRGLRIFMQSGAGSGPW